MYPPGADSQPDQQRGSGDEDPEADVLKKVLLTAMNILNKPSVVVPPTRYSRCARRSGPEVLPRRVSRSNTRKLAAVRGRSCLGKATTERPQKIAVERERLREAVFRDACGAFRVQVVQVLPGLHDVQKLR